MKIFALFIFLAFTATSFSQNTNKELTEKHQQLEKQRLSTDSFLSNQDSLLIQLNKFNKFNDSVTRAENAERNARNVNDLVSMMKERDRKAKQQMWMRLGFGIVLLLVGIYGFTRKRKKAAPKS